MQTMQQNEAHNRYAKCIEVSKRIRWEIDRDVIRGRSFDVSKKFLPDGLSQIGKLGFLSAGEKLLVSQIQGRTYANMFGLCERFIGAKMLIAHWHEISTTLSLLIVGTIIITSILISLVAAKRGDANKEVR